MNDISYIINNIKEEIERPLINSGIYYRIFARQKSDESIKRKLTIKSEKYKKEGKKLQDLIGIRLIFYFIEDVEIVHRYFMTHISGYIETSSTSDDIAKAEQESESLGRLSDKIFMPTRLNMVIRMNERCTRELESIFSQMSEIDSSLIDNTFELQLRTVLSEGWHEVEHDLRYKTKDEPWWNNCEDESRMLNGIYATLETSERSMDQIFSTIAHKNYKKGEYSAMMRNHFKIRTIDTELSMKLKDAITDAGIAKSLLRADRSEIIEKLMQFRLPLKLDNIIFLVNRLSREMNVQAIIDLEPEPIKNMLDKEGL